MGESANENARARDELERAQEPHTESKPDGQKSFGSNDAEARGPRMPSSADLELLVAAGHDLVQLHARDKRPVRANWNELAADNAAVIAAVERGANAGVRLGERDLVIDVDPKNGGDASLARLAAELKLDLSRCPTVRTGSGGAHYYLRRPEGSQLVTNLRSYPGIDFKSSGQVVAPGSVHPNGSRYESNFYAYGPDATPEAPTALLKLLERRPAPTGQADRAGELTPSMLARNLAQLDPDDFAEYSDWMNMMMACHHATNGEGLDEFTEWSIQGTGHSDASEVIAYKWNGLSIDARGVTVQYLYKQLHDRDLDVHDRAEPEDDFDAVEEEPEAARERRWNFLSMDELESLPPPQWLVPGILTEGSIAAIYGAPESGKSFLAVDMSMSVASGIAWHGREVLPGGVLYVAAEGAPGLGKRVRAWKLDRGAASRPIAFSLMRDPLSLTTEKEARDFARAVRSSLGELRMIVVDTLNQTAAGADENSAKEMGQYIAGMKRLRDATGATVVVVHHSGKDEARGMRGSTALLGAMDTTVEVKRSTDGKSIEVQVRKQKDAEREPAMRFNLDKVAGSLVLHSTMMADAADDFGANPIRAMARELAEQHGSRFAQKLLIDAVAKRDGIPTQKARRRIADAIPGNREMAKSTLDGCAIWLERADANPRGEKMVCVEESSRLSQP
jgi:hypothetical protein